MKKFTIQTRYGRSSRNFSKISKFSKFKALLFSLIFFSAVIPNQINADVVVINIDGSIQTYNEKGWTPVSFPIPLSMEGYEEVRGITVTWNSDDLLFYASVRAHRVNLIDSIYLVTVNPVTGICTYINNLGDVSYENTPFSLTYSSITGKLYTMFYSLVLNNFTLYSLNTLTGERNFLGGPYPQGEAIAYNYDDSLIYSFFQSNVQKINTYDFTYSQISLTGSPFDYICGIVYMGSGVFAATSGMNFPIGTIPPSGFNITSNGMVSVVAPTTNQIFGFAFVDPVLPVELTSFHSSLAGNNLTLNWKTANETNNAGFDIERSMVNGQWSTVGNVVGNGTSTSVNNYSFTDRNLSSGNYNYRLKQIDFNGNFEYFNLSNEVNVGVPANFEISQNYPNPFNPTTKIEYQLPNDGKVNISVFDNAGKEVASIVNEFKAAGYYTVNFNGASLSSGVYFYKITSGSFSGVKKMMLVK